MKHLLSAGVQDWRRPSKYRDEGDKSPKAEQYADAMALTPRERRVAEDARDRIAAYRHWRMHSESGGSFYGETGMQVIERELPSKGTARQCKVAQYAVLLAKADGLMADQRNGGAPAIDDQTAEKIRAEHEAGDVDVRNLAARYGVSKTVIQDVLARAGAYSEEAA